MRAKGILTAVLAAGVLLLAPGLDGARADDNHRHRNNHQQAYNGHAYGWWGQHLFGDHRRGGHAYGQRARSYYRDGLTRHERKKLKRIRHSFDNERAFRRYLRHNKPRLFSRYMDHNRYRHHYADNHRRHRHADGHRRQRHADDHRHHRQRDAQRRHRAQHYVWHRDQARRPY